MNDPNPAPKSKYKQDNLIQFGGWLMTLRRSLYLLSVPHILLTALWDHPPQQLCPNHQNVNPKYFTCSPYLVACLTLVITFGTLRLMAFQTLGAHFTFNLTKPKKLITTGLYSYLQHPSYLPIIVISATDPAIFSNPDGWIGCYLSLESIRALLSYKLPILFGLTAFLVLIIWLRILDEERMLHETFGEEWVAWHKKTARFIPWLF
jgi:protein-S-isoprenylcysteine O-methyltransferase Ste14